MTYDTGKRIDPGRPLAHSENYAMHAHKVIVPMTASRRCEIELPADFPVGDVEIIAIAADAPEASPAIPKPGSREAIRAGTAVIDGMDFPRRTKEEIDRELVEERAGWGEEG